jgi:subtilisin family serine protease
MTDEAYILGFDATLEKIHPAPGTWLIPEVPPLPEGYVGKGARIAIVDTGVVKDHPLLRGRIVDEVDLTGEGVEDQNGHGTSVAAIVAAQLPEAELISVKAVGLTGSVAVEVLAQGILEAGRLLGPGGGQINVSVGRRDPSCSGGCILCRAAAQVQAVSGVVLMGAAGNTPGKTFCPARAGISVGTDDPESADCDVRAQPPDWGLEGQN